MQLQGDLVDLLPPAGGTTARKKLPGEARLVNQLEEEIFLTTSKQARRTTQGRSKQR